MKKAKYFLSACLFPAIVSCTVNEIITPEFLYDNEATKSDVRINPDFNEFKVDINAAKRYSELRYPGKSYSLDVYTVKSDTTLYVFNYEGGGWLVVPGDRRVDPSVAESPKGKVDLEDDHAYVSYLKSVGSSIYSVRDSQDVLDADAVKLWGSITPVKAIDHGQRLLTKGSYPKWVVRSYVITQYSSTQVEVPHLIKTKWGQGEPWNDKLPVDLNDNCHPRRRCETGCVSVAVSQMLYYLHYHIGYPKKLYHDINCSVTVGTSPFTSVGFSRSNLVTNSSRWDSMYSENNLSGSTSYVGDLMLDVGNRYGMIYRCKYAGGSEAYMSNVSALSNYGITCSSRNYYTSTIVDNLRNELPVIITATGETTNSHTPLSHAWIIDGLFVDTRDFDMMRVCEYTYDWTYDDEMYDSFEEVQQRYGFSDPYEEQYYRGEPAHVYSFLMNWGEDGIGDDAYYSVSSPWLWNGNNRFNDNKRIYYDFRRQ